MSEIPNLDGNLDSATFKSFYYLKEELIQFCRRNGLQTTGGKPELTDRISYYLDTGERLISKAKSRTSVNVGSITENSRSIETPTAPPE